MTNRKTPNHGKSMPEKIIPRAHDIAQHIRFLNLWKHKNGSTIDLDAPIFSSETNSVSVLLASIFGNSPYLSKSAIKNPECIKSWGTIGASAAWGLFIEDFESDISCVKHDLNALKLLLRQKKEQAALYIALSDICGAWELSDVTEHLSEFADLCVSTCLNTLLNAEARNGNFNVSDEDQPHLNSGLFVLAVGKLGASELNYSSDIDLMVLYNPELPKYTGSKSPQEFSIKLTKALISLLDDRTADGYVFRTDLRLRPDPGSTSIAISTEAAELYYESWGQNWERAALIKARVIAGDTRTGASFLKFLEPFIWRKSLDFYALQDIHSIKRQIYAIKGGANIDLLGHDIKSGRGGIREIEFFVQIQQLIWGGKNKDLRPAQTLVGLIRLEENNIIKSEVVAELSDSYNFLRRLEHRMQMINDEQTQKIPDNKSSALALAVFCGFENLSQFEADVTFHLRQVERHYAALFEDTPKLTIKGNLVFTGTEHDADTLKTLQSLGFQNPKTVSQIIRSWHLGRCRATKSTRSRQILTEIVPSLLSALSKTTQPDKALTKFNNFLEQLPAGVQLFSVFYSHPVILDLLCEIMGDAPRLADYLTTSSARIDYILDPYFFEALPPRKELLSELTEALGHTPNFEAKLDACRRWANDLQFRTGIQVLRSLITPTEGAKTLSSIAESTIAALVPCVCREFERKFGIIDSGKLAILAYGKLGSSELMPTSDLDLVIIYDAPQNVESRGGLRSLPPAPYYTRLAQRIFSALTVRTSEGELYEVDLRLRPSGAQGPTATSIQAFEKYQFNEAWAWEHLALTRAKPVFDTGHLGHKISKIIRAVLSKNIHEATLAKDVSKMRSRIRHQHPQSGQWDIKHMNGGLLDAEFIIQFLTLLNYNRICANHLLDPIASINQLLAMGILTNYEANTLRKALSLWINILWLYRLSIGEREKGAEISLGLVKRILAVSGSSSMKDLRQKMRETSLNISQLFEDKVVSTSKNS
ncbi:MAG: bifunctional [glutamine synthetase] adenylyltransferase/[glutamine synthetase]-adenylyl-L-tyrosine phosphorylase [Rhodospirillaceae bacterium]|nr:bifunctional [glutamine synthetase] adenylyltransferase/[glutamine synthetase]-adenylyl-L-tyrosine phosphorylase [Rhodospirillaceae bacterium]